MDREEWLEEWTKKLVAAIQPPCPPFTIPPAWRELAHASVYKVINDVYNVGIETGRGTLVTQKQLVNSQEEAEDPDGYHGC